MIDTLPTEAKINWQEQLSTLLHAYNCSHLNVTGFSSFYLMCGRHPMCYQLIYSLVYEHPILMLLHHIVIFKNSKRLDWEYKIADEVSKKESECSKK